jgi:hypothetical protein
MQLEPNQRRLVNIAITRAKAYEREQLAQERADMLSELAALKAEMLAEFFAFRDELTCLRNYYHAHREHIAAKEEVVAIRRRHAIERAMEARRDPTAPLH